MPILIEKYIQRVDQTPLFIQLCYPKPRHSCRKRSQVFSYRSSPNNFMTDIFQWIVNILHFYLYRCVGVKYHYSCLPVIYLDYSILSINYLMTHFKPSFRSSIIISINLLINQLTLMFLHVNARK